MLHAIQCPHCGVTGYVGTCPQCRTLIPDVVKQCPHCGAKGYYGEIYRENSTEN
ncbi:MAG: zinc-ribbon domain-containing protein [Candidatus Heimdallarchaeota archaeon]